MRDRYRHLLLGLSTGHLVLVVLGVINVNLPELGPIGRALGDYSLLSGADNGFGFFAPGVFGQFKAYFDVVDGEGRRTTTSLETGSSHEADLYVDHIASEFDTEDPELRRSLAASLAGKVFTRHPEAREVVVRIERFESISTAEFRAGERPPQNPFYEATFSRQDVQKGAEPDGTIHP